MKEYDKPMLWRKVLPGLLRVEIWRRPLQMGLLKPFGAKFPKFFTSFAKLKLNIFV